MGIPAHTPKPLEGETAPSARPLPPWARWDGHPGRLYTLGVEDEIMLLDPSSWSLAQASDGVLAGLPREMASSVRPETHAGVVELVTGIHSDVAGAASELSALRARIGAVLHEQGLAAAAAGTHPAAEWSETQVSTASRYRLLQKTMRTLVEREPTMALHVHVGVPDAEDAVRLLNALRPVAPIFVALAANSPFSQRRDGGFASLRRTLFQAFPRTGVPRAFSGYVDYVESVDALVAPAAVPDPSFLWWDLRLQPLFGTVELRMMDAQSEVDDIAALVALAQSFARLALEGRAESVPVGSEVVAENTFLAARDGVEAHLIEPQAQVLVPVRELIDDLVASCRPHAAALGCATELEGIRRLSACNGALRQRASLSPEAGFEGLVAGLAERFRRGGEG